MIIIGFGSRSLADRQDQILIVDQAFNVFLKETVNKVENIRLFKHGAAKGADILMAQWAQDMGIKTLTFFAKWNDWKGLPKEKKRLVKRPSGSLYNSLAGFNRNQEMIDSGFDTALCIRMPGKSNGSDDMIERVKATGKPLMIFHVGGKHEWI